MKDDLTPLLNLEKSDGYKRLLMLWMGDLSEIEAKRDNAASKGQESAWRYWAGVEKGFKRAMMRLTHEISVLEEDGGDTLNQPSEMIEKLLREARGETK